MIAANNKRQDYESNWQSAFVDMLPEIRKWLGLAFRQLGSEAREDAVEEAIVHSLLSYSRLHDNGRAHIANASSLAWYAALAVKSGRPTAGKMNGDDPLSRYAQLGNRFKRQNRRMD
jgi:hypothetical protein